MEIVLAWTGASLVIGLAVFTLVIRVALRARALAVDSGWDPMASATRETFRRDITPTGRVRLMLALMAEREANAAGAALHPSGLHRATP